MRRDWLSGLQIAFPYPGWLPTALLVGMIVALGCAYGNSLDGAFVFDDEVSIVDNASIRRLFPLWGVLNAKAEGGRPHDSRPLLNLSLAINYHLHGLWRPGFQIGNLLIHLGCCLLLFDIVRRLVGPLPAAVTALLWAVHPLHTHVITYTIQRAESLAAFWILAAFDAAIVALSRGSLAAAVLAGICGCLGALSKETAVSILPLVAAFDWAWRKELFQGVEIGQVRRVRCALYAALAASIAVIAAVSLALGGRGGAAGLGTAPIGRYMLTQSRAIWLYLGRVAWPATLVLDHGERLAGGVLEVWPYVIATTILLMVTAGGFWLRPRTFFPLVAAGILLAPTSSFVPLAMQTVAEHRMYLASACLIGGAVVGLLWGLPRGLRQLGCGDKAAGWAGIAIGLAVAIATPAEVVRTARRNLDFTTADRLWAQNLRDCPENDRGLTNLAATLIRDGRLDEAIPIAEAAIKRAPQRERNWINLGRILAEQGRDPEAIAAFDRAIAMEPNGVDGRVNRAIVLSRGDRIDEAVAVLDEAIRMRPDLAKPRLARGLARLRQQRPDLAVADLTEAAVLDPENFAAWTNLGVAQRQLGNPAGAVASFDRALDLRPGHAGVLVNRARARTDAGDLRAAADDYRRVLADHPAHEAATAGLRQLEP